MQFVEKKIPTTKEAQENKGRLFEFDRDKISEIGIKTAENKIELKKSGQDWTVEAPVKDRADTNSVTTLLTSVELLRSESTIDNEGKSVSKDQLSSWRNRLRTSPSMSASRLRKSSISRTAWITVEWSRPPNLRPISG